MQCPMTNFDCISCDDKCLLEERKRQNDPFRYGNQFRTCDEELIRYGMRAPERSSPSHPSPPHSGDTDPSTRTEE